MPPIDFCKRYEPPTHLWVSQTSTCLVGKFLTDRATRAPLRETNRPGILSPGVALYRYATPVECDRSPDGFTPT